MQAPEIETYLEALGLELQRQGIQQPIRILMVGGAYMLTQLHNRPSTQDVDVLLLDLPDPMASVLYPVIKSAVRTVATQHQLPDSWFNDVIGDALRNNGTVPQGRLWRTFGMLEIFIPPPEYMLALKLIAGRNRDQADIQALCQQLQIISRSQAQAIVDQFIPDTQLQQLFNVDTTLSTLFP